MSYTCHMRRPTDILKPAVASLFAVFAAASAWAQGADVDALLERLANPDTAEWQSLERQITAEWSKSGSPAMDLLLERARTAMEDEEFAVAVEHLTALTDHAPDFAEGWNTRATVFYQMGELGLSLADIQRVLALNPRHFGALSGLAIILTELDRPALALEAWRQVQAIHPHIPQLEDAIERLEKETEGTAL